MVWRNYSWQIIVEARVELWDNCTTNKNFFFFWNYVSYNCAWHFKNYSDWPEQFLCRSNDHLRCVFIGKTIERDSPCCSKNFLWVYVSYHLLILSQFPTVLWGCVDTGGRPASNHWLFLLFCLVKSSYSFSVFLCSFSYLLSSGGSVELISARLSAAFVSNAQAGKREKESDGRPYFSFKEGFTLLPRRRLFVLTPFGFWTRTERICGHKCIRFGLAGLAGGCWGDG